MNNHVINFNRRKKVESLPDDLMTLNALAKKYDISYHFLYRWSVSAKKQGLDCIEPYYFGALKLSENEMKNFIVRHSERRYGGN